PIPLINFMLNFLKELNVSAINLTENEIYNIYPAILSNKDLFISAIQNNVHVLPYKLMSLTLSNKINQNKYLRIFITGVSSLL
ncbi:MAG: hypothetical protein ACP5SQ_07005, partial [Candidatus Saccharicenans sp.]